MSIVTLKILEWDDNGLSSYPQERDSKYMKTWLRKTLKKLSAPSFSEAHS